MSEVMRWKLKGFLPGVEGESKAVFQPVVVLADDYDNAVRLFLDAAERCVAAERREQALQLLLNDRDEQLHTLEQSRRSHFENAQAAERRIEELTRDEHEPVNWAAPKTVRHLIRQLQTLDPDLETHAMLRIPDFKDGKQVRSCPLSISYERMEGPWLSNFKGDGRKVIAVWAKPDHRDPQDQGGTLTKSAESRQEYKCTPSRNDPVPSESAATVNATRLGVREYFREL